MYPCFDSSVTYGLAVTGLEVKARTLPTAITTDGAVYEPNIRTGGRAKQIYATVHVSGLTAAKSYTTFRYETVSCSLI